MLSILKLNAGLWDQQTYFKLHRNCKNSLIFLLTALLIYNWRWRHHPNFWTGVIPSVQDRNHPISRSFILKIIILCPALILDSKFWSDWIYKIAGLMGPELVLYPSYPHLYHFLLGANVDKEPVKYWIKIYSRGFFTLTSRFFKIAQGYLMRYIYICEKAIFWQTFTFIEYIDYTIQQHWNYISIEQNGLMLSF